MSISRYIAVKRVEKACRYLRETDMTITDVAAAVGVPDYNYFCKFFSRRAGISPGEYRKKVTGTETKGKNKRRVKNAAR